MNLIDEIVQAVADRKDRSFDIPFLEATEANAWNLRAKYLKQWYERRGWMDEAVQDLGNVPMELVDTVEIEGYKSTKISRSKLLIPTAINVDPVDKYRFVGSPDRQRRYIATTFENYFERKCVGFPTGNIYYVISRGYLYVLNEIVKYVNVQGMFARPKDAGGFINNKGAKCDFEFNAFMPDDMAPLIRGDIYREYGINPETLSSANEIKVDAQS